MADTRGLSIIYRHVSHETGFKTSIRFYYCSQEEKTVVNDIAAALAASDKFLSVEISEENEPTISVLK